MPFFHAGWYVIYTRHQQENKVVRHLEDKELNHYLPTVKKLRQWNNKPRFVQVPLFPSYVFVRLNEQKHYFDAVTDNTGFLYFVKTGKMNARLDDNVISNIRLMLENGTEVESIAEPLEPGTSITIQKGPLAGLSGQVVQHNNRQKVLVRVELLNRSVLTTLPTEFL